jgi:hypothetical protein
MFHRSTVALRTVSLPLVLAFVCASVASVMPPAASDAAAAAPQLRRYPYLTDLVGNHVLINWATDRSATRSTARRRWRRR